MQGDASPSACARGRRDGSEADVGESLSKNFAAAAMIAFNRIKHVPPVPPRAPFCF